MMRKHVVAACIALLAVPVMAADPAAAQLLSQGGARLTKQQQQALAVTNRWESHSVAGMTAVPGPNGQVRFVYGAQQATLVCAVLHGCDVALQPGENINESGLHLGDAARWTVEPGLEGSGTSETLHLIIKPKDVGLQTTLFVFTDRRRYTFKLRSHLTENMTTVGFEYPEEANARMAQMRRVQQQERQDRTIPATGEYLGDLSFAYDFDNGPKHLRPVRVYNDGRKTVVEMPPETANGELLSLVLLRKEGGDFSEDQPERVATRYQNGRYIVDAVFDRAILIAGVGSEQQRVTITRRTK
jgi:type IV secretion system protein VirB9